MCLATSTVAFAQNKAPKKSANKTQVKSKTATSPKTKPTSKSTSTNKTTKSKPVKYVGKEFKKAVKSVKKEL
ncbi:MAG: hypothetical protein CO118_01340 [Flavobacteriales bacterium CG_4_9_14_3_um_filter_32_8]|nr:MAG: hypothetical protein CO118_01340 [Flavobacteriales bacterium CG_4_9_14_3_um_filter_32_8]